jgi:hypothetical protein
MLEAKKASVWRNRYNITSAGLPLVTWDGSAWKHGGTFELAGQRYSVRGNMWGSKYGMVDEHGTRVASADRVGRKHWTVEVQGQTYSFRRVSMWRNEEELLVEGRRVGSVKRTSVWRRDAVADLPGLAPPVQIFVLAVVLTMWDEQAAAATSAGAA